MTVVSRLRKDAALWTVPGPRPTGTAAGRPRIYGERRIDLAKRAGQRRGWATGTFDLYGKPTAKRYKTFVATWRPAGGRSGWCWWTSRTGGSRSSAPTRPRRVADILGSRRRPVPLEIAFRDVKEVVGAGQQQVRFVWASVGAFHVCLWTFTMTEAWAWGRAEEGWWATGRASPWDDEPRRPSHADKRRAWRRELLAEEIRAVLRPGADRAGNPGGRRTPAQLGRMT